MSDAFPAIPSPPPDASPSVVALHPEMLYAVEQLLAADFIKLRDKRRRTRFFSRIRRHKGTTTIGNEVWATGAQVMEILGTLDE